MAEESTNRREATRADARGAPIGCAEGNPPTGDGFGIGQAARALGLHPRTLMAYERIGLIRPRRRRTRRVYQERDLRWLSCMHDMNRTAGVSLRGLAMLRRFVPCWAVRQVMENAPAVSFERPGHDSLHRVVRAYGGEAPGICRECEVYRGDCRDARAALASRNAPDAQERTA